MRSRSALTELFAVSWRHCEGMECKLIFKFLDNYLCIGGDKNEIFESKIDGWVSDKCLDVRLS